MAKPSNEAELLSALQQLPKAIQPRRDLWTDIAANLGAGEMPAKRLRQPWLAVAGVLLALTIGVWVGRGMEAPGNLGPVLADTESIALQQALLGLEEEYQAQHRALQGAGGIVLADSAYRDAEGALAANWEVLQSAADAIRAALATQPNNPFLLKKMLRIRQQQLNYLQRLGVLSTETGSSI